MNIAVQQVITDTSSLPKLDGVTYAIQAHTIDVAFPVLGKLDAQAECDSDTEGALAAALSLPAANITAGCNPGSGGSRKLSGHGHLTDIKQVSDLSQKRALKQNPTVCKTVSENTLSIEVALGFDLSATQTATADFLASRADPDCPSVEPAFVMGTKITVIFSDEAANTAVTTNGCGGIGSDIGSALGAAVSVDDCSIKSFNPPPVERGVGKSDSSQGDGSTSPTSSEQVGDPDSDSQSGLPTWALATAVVGGLAVLVAAIAGVVVFRRRLPSPTGGEMPQSQSARGLLSSRRRNAIHPEPSTSIQNNFVTQSPRAAPLIPSSNTPWATRTTRQVTSSQVGVGEVSGGHLGPNLAAHGGQIDEKRSFINQVVRSQSVISDADEEVATTDAPRPRFI